MSGKSYRPSRRAILSAIPAAGLAVMAPAAAQTPKGTAKAPSKLDGIKPENGKPEGLKAGTGKQDGAKQGQEGGVKVPPKDIWPAGLERLQGTYVFVQVASPGGLWESYSPTDGASTRKQVSINELPAAFREKLLDAELTISDVKLPTEIDASQKESPSKRGMLRYYDENATGKLRLRNLPGIGGDGEDKGAYNGPVEFHLNHQSHSNPSAVGIFQQRMNQEPTWGAAAIDYADLEAVAIPLDKPDGLTPKSPNGEKGKPAAPKPGAQGKEGEQPDHEVPAVIGNARVLRYGMEIIVFVEWLEENEKGRRQINGAVRLFRKDALPSTIPVGRPPKSIT
jgi:hypothetical protein